VDVAFGEQSRLATIGAALAHGLTLAAALARSR
jgi:hypothetical protein